MLWTWQYYGEHLTCSTRAHWWPNCWWTTTWVQTSWDWHNQRTGRGAHNRSGEVRFFEGNLPQWGCYFHQWAWLAQSSIVIKKYGQPHGNGTNGQPPPVNLKNTMPEYAVPNYACSEYEMEFQLWLDNGWLLQYPRDELGSPKCLIPLMVLMQESKQKVCPVLDYQDLNGFVEPYTANSEVCAQKLCEWWRLGANISLLDLWRAYLQIRVDKILPRTTGFWLEWDTSYYDSHNWYSNVSRQSH